MVSAWATANHWTLGQVVVNAKSNEITTIPKLLELLDVSGRLATIDASGRQAEVAERIVEAKADYVLAVKGNQPTLHEGIKAFFLDHLKNDFARLKVSRHEDDRARPRASQAEDVRCVRRPRGAAGSGAVAGADADRAGDQRHGAGRKAVR
jgi:predicted transposase YbfD/YdcC